MTNDNFLTWHRFHVEAFSLAPEDAKTVATWRKALDGFSVAELRTASIELLIAAPESFRNQHVPGFFRILARNRERARHKGQFASACQCPSCQLAKGAAPATSTASELPAKFSFVREARKRGAKCESK